jgi:hypothetical protein
VVDPQQALVPQQLPVVSPWLTRSAASPYFAFTIFFSAAPPSSALVLLIRPPNKVF